jgi:hypothetical protein
MTTAAQSAALRANSDDLTTRFLGDLFTILTRMDGRPPTFVRDVLLEMYPLMLEPYREMAAQMYASWYEEVRLSTVGGPFVATTGVQPLSPDATDATVRWGVGPLFGQGDSTAIMRLGGAAQRLILDAGRNAIDVNARRDPVSVSWSRVAQPGACDFCKMLAGRGPVYRSPEAAGLVVGRGVDPERAFDEAGRRRRGGIGGGVKSRGSQQMTDKYHDHCRCVPKATWYEIGPEVQVNTRTGQTRPILVPIPDE